MTDMEHETETFCGSAAESLTSDHETVYVRFYAEGEGIQSKFKVIFTALRPIPDTKVETCDEEVVDIFLATRNTER